MIGRDALLHQLDLRSVVNGEPFEDGGWMKVLDPATSAQIAEVPEISEAGVDEAVRSATRAQPAWSAQEPRHRAAALLKLATLMERRADQLAGIEALDVGKPIDMTPAEVSSSVDKIRFFAGACRVLSGAAASNYRSPFHSFVRREPVGVVAALAPWNYPLALAIWKIIPALAVGNAVVLKPSPETPLSSVVLGQIAAEILPPGVLNVVTGGASTGQALVQHPGVDMVSLTGGTATGKAVMRDASASLKRLHLELGGNAPVLVFDDADLERLRDAYFMAAFRNTGQDCHAASRVYAPRRIADAVAETIRGVVDGQVRVGDNLEHGTNMGPLVSRAQLERVQGLVERAEKLPHVEHLPTRYDDQDPRGGYYFTPTVLLGPQQGDEIVQSEIFGPVVTITECDDEEQAISYANGTAFGLAASVWTRNTDRALRVASALRVGTVWVNGHGGTIAEMPFGGFKESGFGRDLGVAALEQHTELKHVAISVLQAGTQ